MTDAHLLTVNELEVVYQRTIVALHGVDLTAESGRITAILGSNGAGKTTTLRAISGFIGLDQARMTKGSIRFKGRELRNQTPHLVAGLGITIVPERNKVFPNLSVSENLAVVLSNKSGAERRRTEELVYDYFPRLGSMRGKEGGLLSGGERQMLGIGAALVCGPELLLIDELSLGLAPAVDWTRGTDSDKNRRRKSGSALLVAIERRACLSHAHAIRVPFAEPTRLRAT